jgi:hypothetical protein
MDARNFMEKNYPEAVKFFDQIGSDIDSDITSAVVDMLEDYLRHKLTEQPEVINNGRLNVSPQNLARRDRVLYETGRGDGVREGKRLAVKEHKLTEQTLDREKVMEILNAHDDTLIDQYEDVWGVIPSDSYGDVADAICSLSLHTLSEEELWDLFDKYCSRDNVNTAGIMDWKQFRAAIKELTKDK